MTPEQIASIPEWIRELEEVQGLLDEVVRLAPYENQTHALRDGFEEMVRRVQERDAEITFLNERLDRANTDRDEAVRDCQKAEGRFDLALDILDAIEQAVESEALSFPPGLLRERLRAFMDSE